MTSPDRELLIAIKDEVHALSERAARLEDTVAIVVQNVDALDRRLTRVEDKVDSLQDSVYWGFAVIAFVVALLGVFVPILLSRKDNQTPAPQQPVFHVYTYPAMPVKVQEADEVKA